jgi:hypothetical protein
VDKAGCQRVFSSCDPPLFPPPTRFFFTCCVSPDLSPASRFSIPHNFALCCRCMICPSGTIRSLSLRRTIMSTVMCVTYEIHVCLDTKRCCRCMFCMQARSAASSTRHTTRSGCSWQDLRHMTSWRQQRRRQQQRQGQAGSSSSSSI